METDFSIFYIKLSNHGNHTKDAPPTAVHGEGELALFDGGARLEEDQSVGAEFCRGDGVFAGVV